MATDPTKLAQLIRRKCQKRVLKDNIRLLEPAKIGDASATQPQAPPQWRFLVRPGFVTWRDHGR